MHQKYVIDFITLFSSKMRSNFLNNFFRFLQKLMDREIQSARCRGDFEKFQPFALKPSRNEDMNIFRFLPLYEHFAKTFEISIYRQNAKKKMLSDQKHFCFTFFDSKTLKNFFRKKKWKTSKFWVRKIFLHSFW